MAAKDWISYDSWKEDEDPRSFEPVVVAGKLIHETAKAWLVKVGVQEVWLPKSQCQRHQNVLAIEDEFTLPSWLADKKGL